MNQNVGKAGNVGKEGKTPEEQSHSVYLQAEGVSKVYETGSRIFGRKPKAAFKAVDQVSLQIYRGETLGLVGESGCGKSTLGKCLLRAIQPTEGKILLAGQGQEWVDFTNMSSREVRAIRSQMQMIFQDPFNSLNPNMTVRDLIGEPLLFTGKVPRSQMDERVAALMADVGLDSRYMGRYPHAFSGGQRQRICIARAIATQPEFIVCDEAVSALDVSVRAQIINLLMDLQEQRGMAYLFISHDLSVVRHISHRVAVLYAGRIVEQGDTEEIFFHTAHPYTRLLLDSAPKLDAHRKPAGEVLPDAGDLSPASEGCHFAPRCPRCQKRCTQEVPPLKDLGGGHQSACFFCEEA